MKRFLSLLLLAAACSASKPTPMPKPQVKLTRFGKPYKEGIVAPAWIDKLPENGKAKIYGVGYSAPTFWPQDALNNAAQDARGKLALSLASHVEVLGIDTMNGKGNGGATIDKEATDMMLQNSRIEATWVDENGDRGEPASVWALASYEVGSARAQGADWTGGSAKAAPSWLDRLPGSSAKVYAAGYSGPTFKPGDAVKYAGEKALDNLAASLRAHVQAYTLLVENKSGLSLDQFSQTDDPDQAFLDLVRQNAKVEATWVDGDAVRPGDPPGAVWALASIEVQSTKGGMQEVQNTDLGPALDKHGNIIPDPPAAVPATGKSPASSTKP
jgi:hypothetical protein